MGSQVTETEDEFTVLVTGFAPFKAAYPINPSWEIASRLPAYLLEQADPSENYTATKSRSIRILVHPEAIRVNYQTVRGLVPRLWSLPDKASADGLVAEVSDEGKEGCGEDGVQDESLRVKPHRPSKIDICIHIGMAGPRMLYSLEHRGHRDGYTMPDVDGNKLHDEERKKTEGADWIWTDVPDELETDMEVRDVLQRWRKHSRPDIDLRVSEDAGHYLCDFIYFSSLAHLYKRGDQRRVVFLHVPCDASDNAIAQGTEVTTNLIRALVESELRKREEVAVRNEGKIAVEFHV